LIGSSDLAEVAFVTGKTHISFIILMELVAFAETSFCVNVFDFEGITWFTCSAEVLGFTVETRERTR
jgi:hypothetical protein